MKERSRRLPYTPRATGHAFPLRHPVYNEERYLESVLHEVHRYSPHILVVNDGSTDRTPEMLAHQSGVEVITHPKNRGYGPPSSPLSTTPCGMTLTYW